MTKKFSYTYHSALHDPIINIPCTRFESDHVLALQHDMSIGIPNDVIERCDVIYGEPPWLRGIEVFNQRVGISTFTFDKLVTSICNIIEASKIPMYFIVAAHLLKKLPKPVYSYNIILNTSGAFVVCYNTDKIINAKTNLLFIVELAKVYNCVWDFCCGYGNTGRIFRQYKKNAVLSDFDAQCIGYIKEHSVYWEL
ncbi:MAG: hypothetical protein LBE13_09650 [Bacteroidales bacterium]|jgi:hypothetical protein|nr:hypothetical protein [Bacteroidales bacterium]